jgi:hypothetical protein
VRRALSVAVAVGLVLSTADVALGTGLNELGGRAGDAGLGRPLIVRQGRGSEPRPTVLSAAVHATSTGESGYVAYYPSYDTGFTLVSAKWVEPSVTCPVPKLYDPAEAFWVGFTGDGTVEQAGSFVFCSNGTPYHWSFWEMYPTTGLARVFQIQPGDVIKSKVTYHPSSGRFVMIVKDLTSAQSFVQRSTCGAGLGCSRISANWIVEDTTDTLPDWGTLRFYHCHARSDTGTIGTVSGPAWSYTPIDMVDGSGNLRAHVSSLNATGAAFRDTWDAP